MTTSSSNNPFVMPGMGQSGDMASNPLFASLEMMRQTFATLSGPNGLASNAAMQPTLDPAELEKKIAELKSVESWLKLNLSMLSSTIQGMEVQHATITTLRQFVSAQPSGPSGAEAKTDAAQAWWTMLTEQFGQLAAATSAATAAATSATSANSSDSTKRTPAKKAAVPKKTK